ncbi:hydantoinase/oxoprolinase family protein, partial [Inquilinus limosus]|uniref:hydantoinase/oxoprolinase family protein n=1 Tax=Inquilinus limosus TaxID=171674 RepID=UPI001930AF9C
MSGPAASVVGARWLTGRDDCFVSDIGGTTTDIAVLKDGRPLLEPPRAPRSAAGATDGRRRWRSATVRPGRRHARLRIEPGLGLAVGPRRSVPLSLLAAPASGDARRRCRRRRPSRPEGLTPGRPLRPAPARAGHRDTRRRRSGGSGTRWPTGRSRW